MKKIEVLIRHEALESVQAALSESGLRGMTVTEVRGFGRGSLRGSFGGLGYARAFLPKLKVEVLVADADLERAVRVLARGARTEFSGDECPVVLPVEEVYCVRTGETAEAAVSPAGA